MVRDMEIMLSGVGSTENYERDPLETFSWKTGNQHGIARFWKPFQIFEVLSYGSENRILLLQKTDLKQM